MQLKIDLPLPLDKVFALLVIIEVLFLMVDSITFSFDSLVHEELKKLVDITLEANLPTWFSSTQALVTGLVALIIGTLRRGRGMNMTGAGWYLTGLFFIYLGIDDAAQIHERISTAAGDAAGSAETKLFIATAIQAFPSYYWQLLFLPVFGIIGLIMLYLIYREFEERRIMLLFIAGAGLYVIAVGLDYLDGIASIYDVLVEGSILTFDDARHISRAIEEFIEMLGTTCILVSFLHHLDRVQVSGSR